MLSAILTGSLIGDIPNWVVLILLFSILWTVKKFVGAIFNKVCPVILIVAGLYLAAIYFKG